LGVLPLKNTPNPHPSAYVLSVFMSIMVKFVQISTINHASS
jgi:hypothetical protein